MITVQLDAQMCQRPAVTCCARWATQAGMAFDRLVGRMAEKWREVPGGTDQQPRQFSDDLLQSSIADLLAWWERQFEAARAFRGWYWGLYGDALKGKRVLEIGSGLGFDAVQLASQGVAVTCGDIVPSNLEIVRRVAEARGGRRAPHRLGATARGPLPRARARAALGVDAPAALRAGVTATCTPRRHPT